MAYLPRLYEVDAKRTMISEFGGYHHNLRISDNEFYDMKNLCSDHYPVICPRKQRGVVRSFTTPNGLFAHNKLCWVDSTDFYYNGSKVDGFTLANSKKQFVGMGAYILIWPDKAYYNTADGSFGTLGNEGSTAGTVSISLTKYDGTPYSGYTASATAPSNPTNGQLWIDTGSAPHVLKQYSADSASWTSIATTYVKITAAGIGSGFAEYDGVTISGVENDALNGDFILYGAGSDYIIVTAIIDAVATQTAAVTVARKIPDMDFITESENRVWGCSSANHEIYACKLGDPKNWNSFLNISTDSYYETVGSTGDFTGACAHGGYVLFFKEDVIHSMAGTKPSNFTLETNSFRGVEKGSERSIAVVNETLYYKSRNDVCAYASSMPTAVSEKLGMTKYKNAAAGALGSKYYISMQDEAGTWTLLVYDSDRGLWHKEDNVQVGYFASIAGDLYFINEMDKKLYSAKGDISSYSDAAAAVEPPLDWYAESGDIGLDAPDFKYISKIQIRVALEAGSSARVAVQYDQGPWVEKYLMNPERRRTYVVPIIPRRCDVMRFRLSGKGPCSVYSITKTIEQGSEV